MQYGKLEDGRITYAESIYITDDGRTIINFNSDESIMLENGFKPVHEATKPINDRHYTISYEEHEEEIIEVLTYTETEEEYQRRKEEEAQQREYERLSKLNLTKADFWIALLEKGVTKDMVKEKIALIPDENLRIRTLIRIDEADHFWRGDASMDIIAAMFGISPEDLTYLFEHKEFPPEEPGEPEEEEPSED